MIYLVIGVVSFLASSLTLFSGFGLGTILTPAFVLFFPIEIAIALTAVVHLFNNLFKLLLLGRHANKRVVMLFGIPAVIAAILGAKVLIAFEDMLPLFIYQVGSHQFLVLPIKLLIAILIILFTLMELCGWSKNLQLPEKFLPAGGLASGFFGGLSGHQGALRSAFLIKSGLSKEAFIATGVVIACLVDVTRLAIYGAHLSSEIVQGNIGILIFAIACAFAGAYLGNLYLKKLTLPIIQRIVSVMLIIIAVLLGAGVI
jgi:uncharacterized membrane protein YfcA